MTMQRVSRVHTAVSNELVDIELDGDEVITCTPTHRLYTTEWTSAGLLREGDLLVTRDAGTVKVQRIRRRDARQVVFNLVVAGARTYFAGAHGVLVHSDKKVDEQNQSQYQSAPMELLPPRA